MPAGINEEIDMQLELLTDIAPFEWKSIGAALICGFIVGLERQLRGKPVGIRTASLITLGTYIFIAGAVSVNKETSDPSRIIGQVITGIGFLGAGVILSRDGIVMGVTSAATIWSLAAVGACVAIGSALTAIKLALIIVLILYGVEMLETCSAVFTRGVHAHYAMWKDKAKK